MRRPVLLKLVSDVTRILELAQAGEPSAADQLLPLVYDELRRLAAHKMANEVPGQTLQPTALVHEAWLRLSNQSNTRWQNREHFYAMAAEVMRRILVDRARRRQARKHGGQLVIGPEERFEGSVSGGCVEAAVITAAAEVMATGSPKVL